MSRDEKKKLKDSIYNKVDQLDDEIFLQMVEAVTAYSSPSQKDILEELTPEQKQRLHESLKQANEGKTIHDDEVRQKAKEWILK